MSTNYYLFINIFLYLFQNYKKNNDWTLNQVVKLSVRLLKYKREQREKQREQTKQNKR